MPDLPFRESSEQSAGQLSDRPFSLVACLLAVVGFAMAALVYWCVPANESIAHRFLPSWNGYLQSFDTSPQLAAYKTALLFWLIAGLGCAFLLKPREGIRRSRAPAPLAVVGASLVCVAAAISISLQISKPFFFVLGCAGFGALLALAYHAPFPLTKWLRHLLAFVALLVCGATLVWGVASRDAHGLDAFTQSSFFSWHYGAYFQDAVRLADQQPFSQIEGHYGVAWQTVAGLWQQRTGWWGVNDYVSFTRMGQTAILAVILIWLGRQYFRHPSWWPLLFAFFLCLIYHGGAMSAMNGTQSLLRRAGMVFFCLSLGLFAEQGRGEQRRWVAGVHGLAVGAMFFVSTEFGMAMVLIGAAFWGMGEDRSNPVSWLKSAGAFLLGSAVMVGALIGTTWTGANGLSIVQLFMFLATPLQEGFAGLPLEYSPLAFLTLVLAGGIYLHGCVRWSQGPLSCEHRAAFACAAFSLLTFMYYLQRNADSSLHTPLLPLGFAAVYLIRASGVRPVGPAAPMRSTQWWLPICISIVLLPNIRWQMKHLYESWIEADKPPSPAVQPVSTFGPTQQQLAAFEQLDQRQATYVLVSPYTFHFALGLQRQNRVPRSANVFDWVYGIVTAERLAEVARAMREEKVAYVLFEEQPVRLEIATDAEAEQQLQMFFRGRYDESQSALRAVGYHALPTPLVPGFQTFALDPAR